MFGQLKTRTGKILLWLLALAVLCFVASLFPSICRHLPWFKPQQDDRLGALRVR